MNIYIEHNKFGNDFELQDVKDITVQDDFVGFYDKDDKLMYMIASSSLKAVSNLATIPEERMWWKRHPSVVGTMVDYSGKRNI